MASLVANNAVGWVQFQLNGGWKNTLLVLVGYAVIIGGLMVVTASIEPREATTVYSVWSKGLLGLQMAILVIYGSNRVVSGIRRDLTGQMESHRLMPIPPSHAVFGYIFGAASQAISLALVNVMIGAFATRSAGLPMAYWLKANFVVGTCSVFLWTVVAVSALSARGALFWVIGPMVAFWFSGGALALLIPAVSVLGTPTQGVSVFDARLADRPLALYAMPGVCQGLIGLICVAAAMRKYRRPHDAAFNSLLALSMVAVVALTCTVGLLGFDEIAPRYLYSRGDFEVQIVASTLVFTWFVIAAMCAVSWGDALAQRTARRRVIVGRPPRALPPILGVVLAGAIGVAMVYASTRDWPGDIAKAFQRYAVGVVVVQALAICYLARWVYARADRAAMMVMIWVSLTWLAPLVIDLMLHILREDESGMGTIATWSPIGCLSVVVHPTGANPKIGLAGQFAMALIPLVAYYVDRMRTKRTAIREAGDASRPTDHEPATDRAASPA